MNALIEARSLTKRFGKIRALSELDLVIEPGHVVAILGPNGAGKTTLVRTIATLLRPDGGTLTVAGHDVVREPLAVRRLIGLAGQSAAVEEMMTGRENLHMVARLYGQSRRAARASTDAVLERLELGDAGDRLVRTYSGGMRRRLDLGASLVASLGLLLLDEPTTGLDPRSRIELWDTIRALGAAGTEILLTTQYLDEADQLASHIVIVDDGKVVAEGSPGRLKSLAGADKIEVHTRDAATLADAARALGRLGAGPVDLDRSTRRCSVSSGGHSELLLEAVRALDEAGVLVEDITLRRPTLDEVFLSLTDRRPTSTDRNAGTTDSTAGIDGEGALR
jgi:ABC-2 type transport system ATP-binding protein